MNRSRKLASFILTGGLAAFALSAFAQSSPSSSPSQADPSRPSPSGSNAGTMTAPTTGSTAGSVYGESGQQGNTLKGSGGVAGASAQSANVHGFTSMDRDRDGRISLSEFTASSQSGAAAGGGTAGMVGRSSGSAATGASGATGATETTGTTGRTGTTGSPGLDTRGVSSTGMAGTSAQMEQEFRRLDTDRDGYLSESELSIWQGQHGQANQRRGSGAGAAGSSSTAPEATDKSKDRDRNR